MAAARKPPPAPPMAGKPSWQTAIKRFEVLEQKFRELNAKVYGKQTGIGGSASGTAKPRKGKK